jgi:hypothetical protein
LVERIVRRLSRTLERFNNSFAGSAAASGALNSGHRGANADAVVAVLGEMEKGTGDESKAAGQGLEPQLPDPESGVLPLDDPAGRPAL